MSTKDQRELLGLAQQVLNKIIKMQEECKALRLHTLNFMNQLPS
jgi:hypothetical protein